MMISEISCSNDNSCSDFDLLRVVVWLWSSRYIIIWALRATWLKTILNRAKVLSQFKNKRHVHERSNARCIGAKLHLSFILVWCMSLSSPNTNLLLEVVNLKKVSHEGFSVSGIADIFSFLLCCSLWLRIELDLGSSLFFHQENKLNTPWNNFSVQSLFYF